MKPWMSGAAIAGVIACGLFGAWAAAASTWSEAEITRAVGGSGIAAFAFATFAMFHRSWARLPLVAVCVLSGLLIDAGFFTEYDPSAMTLLGHLFLEVLLIAAGSIAGIITILDLLTRTSTTHSHDERVD